MHPHTLLVSQCLAALGVRPNDCVVWANPSGQLRDENGRPVRYGVGVGRNAREAGGADIIGIVRGGRFLAIECKTGAATPSPGQRRWGAIVTRLGGVYAVARCEADALAALAMALGDRNS